MADLTGLKIQKPKEGGLQLGIFLAHSVLSMIDDLAAAWGPSPGEKASRQDVIRACARLIWSEWKEQEERKRREQENRPLADVLDVQQAGPGETAIDLRGRTEEPLCACCDCYPGTSYECLTCGRKLDGGPDSLDLYKAGHANQIVDVLNLPKPPRTRAKKGRKEDTGE